MRKENPKRFAVIGLPGSGKSTFATKLGKALNIPVHHLDKHQFIAKGKKREQEEFISIQKKLIDEKSWIIDGCSITTLEMRFEQADTVIYFQLPRLLCIWRAFKRLFSSDKTLLDSGCSKVINWRLLKYIWNFNKEKRAQIEKLKKKYPHVDFRIFYSSQDAEIYLENAENGSYKLPNS